VNVFTRNSPYYHLLKYLLFLLKHPVYIYRVFHGSENANYITSLMQQMMFIVFYFTIRLILRTLQTFIIIVTSWWLTWLMNSILIPSVIAKNFTGKVKKKKSASFVTADPDMCCVQHCVAHNHVLLFCFVVWTSSSQAF